MAGTPRYMAPEVARDEPYNEFCDVYSFAILLWQMLALKQPYKGFSLQDLYCKAWCPVPKARPKISTSWPKTIQWLLVKAWAFDIVHRPTMESMETVLYSSVSNGQNNSRTERRLTHEKRRSTFVFQKQGTDRPTNERMNSSPF